MQSMLGKVDVEEGVQVWPLSGMMAHRFGKGRIALIGEGQLPAVRVPGMRRVLLLREDLDQLLAGARSSAVR